MFAHNRDMKLQSGWFSTANIAKNCSLTQKRVQQMLWSLEGKTIMEEHNIDKKV